MTDIRKKFEQICRDHFNEPVLIGLEVGRCIGYATDETDCYIITKYPNIIIRYHTMVGGYYFLDRLKGQNYVKMNDDIDNDDFVRIDWLLENCGCSKENEFILDLWEDK